MARLLPLLVVLAGCDVKDCTLIGCASALTLQVTGAPSTDTLYGTVTVGGQAFVVDCAGTSDPAVLCGAASLTIQLPDGLGGADVTWTLTVPSPDTGMGGGSYVGDGTFTPDWTSSTPNGPDCGPTCWAGEGTVELQGTP